jgi:hypothetical protein
MSDEPKKREMFVRVDAIRCEACQDTHSLSVRLPAYPNIPYTFDCPKTGQKMHLPGLPLVARTILQKSPDDCIEALAYFG